LAPYIPTEMYIVEYELRKKLNRCVFKWGWRTHTFFSGILNAFVGMLYRYITRSWKLPIGIGLYCCARSLAPSVSRHSRFTRPKNAALEQYKVQMFNTPFLKNTYNYYFFNGRFTVTYWLHWPAVPMVTVTMGAVLNTYYIDIIYCRL